MEIAPLRTIDDFILKEAKYQIPDFNDEERWFNRILSNLLYYQTNYFLTGFIIFLLVTFFHPEEMAYGLGVMLILMGLAFYASVQKAEVKTFKRNHPLIFTFGVLTVGYVLIYKLGCIVVFLLGIALPISFAVAHSTFRLRNIKNKITSASDAFGVSKRTPMKIILDELGIEVDLKYIK